MPYIARKPANFDRAYSIGEIIPDAVVDPRRAESLIAIGRIAAAPEAAEAPGEQDAPSEETDQEAAEAVLEDGGVNGPAEDETAAGEPTAANAAKKRGAKK